MRRSIFSLLLLLPLCGAGHAVPAADSLPLHPPAPAIAPATIAFSPAGRTEELPQLAGDTVLSDPLPNRHLTTWTDHHGSLEIRHVPGTDGHDLLAVRQLERDIPTTLQALGLRPRL